MKKLNSQEYRRYARHITLKEVGESGQIELKNARVLLIGAGGLGSPMALYLAAAGVGTLGLVEFDVVDESNLQRQILHGSEEVGHPKIDSAEKRLKSINPFINLEKYPIRLSRENAREIISQYQIVADGSDNFSTRYLVNDACFFEGKPLVSGSILSFEGQLSVFNFNQGPCYRCLYPEPPPPEAAPNCAEAGVLGVLPGLIGTMQATEVLKIILKRGDICSGRLVHFDALATEMTSLQVPKNKECPLCGDHPTIATLEQIEEFCASENAQNNSKEIQPHELKEKIDKVFLIDVRESFEREICLIKEAIHIPLKDLENSLDKIPSDKEIVIHCKMGGRSMKAVELLEQKEIKAKSLAGGILSWADEIDPTLAKY